MLRRRNMRSLAANGIIIWLDRSLDKLVPSDATPLSSTPQDMERLYSERRRKYERYADLRVPADGAPAQTADKMIEQLRTVK